MRQFVKKIGLVGSAVIVAALFGAAAHGQAEGETSSSDAFNIPETVTALVADPNKRRATATVNGTIITGTDIDHRVALIVNANERQPTPDELQALRQQVFRNLVDETLQIQAATEQEIAVTREEVDSTYEQLAIERFNRSAEQLDAHLRSIGSSPQSLKRQIEGELDWDRLLRRNVSPFVNVSSEEVNELYERMQASRGEPEYRIGEIFLSATPATRQAVGENARRIIEQLRQGGSFVAYARQFSEASTAAVGGDLGWIRLAQLQNPQLEEVARGLQPGQLVGPVEIPGGFSILYLIDKRQIGVADPRDALVSLKQISVEFPAGVAEEEARQRTESFAQGVSEIRGCGQADSAAATMGAQVVSNDGIALRALPDALQNTVLQLNVGQATPLYGDESGVRVFMLCGRDEPAAVSGPDREALMTEMEDERIGKRAQSFLRDLRRDAVIEYN